MITTVYTIEELKFKLGEEQDKTLLRFRDRNTRNKYLKNVTLKFYKSQVETGNFKPETYDMSIKSNITNSLYNGVGLKNVLSFIQSTSNCSLTE